MNGQQPLKGKMVLIYTRNGEGYVHDNIASSVAALERICDGEGILHESSDDPGLFTKENLARYDAIIFCNSNNEAFLEESQREAFKDYIMSGKGFGAIHSANASERDWPWYREMLGGKFLRHPPYQEFDVVMTDTLHPSTRELPKRWTVKDECYYSYQLNPRIHVLMCADLNTVEDEQKEQYPGQTWEDKIPLSWTHDYAGGRQWYSALGHDPGFYSDPLLVAHLRGGVRWILGGN